MGKDSAKRRLVMGKIVASVETEKERFELAAGRWTDVEGGESEDCVVVTQQRRKGDFGYGSPFRMVMPVEVVRHFQGPTSNVVDVWESDAFGTMFEVVESDSLEKQEGL